VLSAYLDEGWRIASARTGPPEGGPVRGPT
jgi:hypothetical protein